MTSATLWWLAAGLLVGLELLTGTVYLLVLALGLVAGAVAAHLGWAVSAQLLTAALVGAAAVTLWHRLGRPGGRARQVANRDLHLDVGERVLVDRWQHPTQTQVSYRGSAWQARLHGPGPGQPGWHHVVAVEANHLVLAPDAAAPAAPH